MLKKNELTIRHATADEKQHWNELVAHNSDGGSFLQTLEFARFKQKEHWRPRYIIIEMHRGKLAVLALCRYVFPLGEIWYFPKGPGARDYGEFRKIARVCQTFIKANYSNTFLIQFEPEIRSDIQMNALDYDGLLSAPSIQSSTSTVIVSLEGTPETILAGFSKRARYYVRLGSKENIAVNEARATEKNFRRMYALMATASNGRGVRGIRPYEYYRDFWRVFMAAGLGKLYFAYEKNVPVVGAFITIFGAKATYKDGGSDPRRRSKGASYLLQWHIMKELQPRGIKTYDMWGALTRRGMSNTTHPYYGVSLFKTAFNKQITEYCGTLDYAFSSLKYKLWRRFVYPLYYRVDRLRARHFY